VLNNVYTEFVLKGGQPKTSHKHLDELLGGLIQEGNGESEEVCRYLLFFNTYHRA